MKITNELVKSRFEFAKKISSLTYMNKNQRKKEITMTEEEKEKIRKFFYMNFKIKFCQKSKIWNNIPPPKYSDTNYQPINSPDNAFIIESQEVVLKDYQIGSIYQIDLSILNPTQLLTSFKYIPLFSLLKI